MYASEVHEEEPPVSEDSDVSVILIDWLSCGFTSHSTQNRSFRRRSPEPISWLGMDKTKSNTTRACIHQWNENTKTLKPGLVAFYDIQPGNGAGPFPKKKVSKRGDKSKEKKINGEAYDINKWTI